MLHMLPLQLDRGWAVAEIPTNHGVEIAMAQVWCMQVAMFTHVYPPSTALVWCRSLFSPGTAHLGSYLEIHGFATSVML